MYDKYPITEIIDMNLAIIYPNIIESYKIWTFMTYSLVHYNFIHIFGNVVLFIFPCVYLESVYTWKPILLVIIVSVTAASIFQCTCLKLFNSKYTSIIGISGGVYALYGAYFSHHMILHYNKAIRLLSIINIIGGFCMICYDYTYYNNVAVEIHLMGYIYGIFSIVYLLPYNISNICKLLYYVMNININILCFILCPIYLFSN